MKQLFTTLALLSVLLIAPVTVKAYEPDYWINDQFFVETFSTKTQRKWIEIWHIDLLKGLVERKKRFIDFEFVAIELLHLSAKDQYRIGDIDIRFNGRISPEDRNIYFQDGTFFANWGGAIKWAVRIDFNKDGSLRALKGSRTVFHDPEDVMIYSLITKDMNLVIDQVNKIQKKSYFFERRQ
jgi:hypothetical protein